VSIFIENSIYSEGLNSKIYDLLLEITQVRSKQFKDTAQIMFI